MNQINNVIKHQLAEQDQPVWISDKGLESKGVVLTFEQIEELLREVGTLAEGIIAGPKQPDQTDLPNGQ